MNDLIVERHQRIDSTNSAARRRLEQRDAPARFVVIADEQTAGRGTRGRSWQSPPGGLYLTYVDAAPRPDHRPPETLWTLAAGVACAECILALTGRRIRLKPVNDLLWADRKLGGILTETIVRGGAVQALMIGIGINLRPIAPDPAEHPLPTAALDEIHPGIGRDQLAEHLIAHLRALLDRVDEGEHAAIRSLWERWVDEAE